MNDDNEPISPEWLASIGILAGDGVSTRADEHCISINAGSHEGRHSVYGDEPGDTIYLLITPADGMCFIESTATGGTDTKEAIEIGRRETRGQFRLLLRALGAWDSESFHWRKANPSLVPKWTPPDTCPDCGGRMIVGRLRGQFCSKCQ